MKAGLVNAKAAWRGFLAAAMVAVLAACAASVLNPTAPQLYTLTPRDTVDPTLPRVNWQLLVEAPVAPAGINTPRIAVARSSTALDYFAEVSWTDRAPAMVQGLIVESFEDSGKIVSVGRDTVGLRSDFILKSELRDFQAEYTNGQTSGQPDQVHVRVAVKLVNSARRTIEAGETFEAVIPVKGSAFTDTIEAFNVALGQVMDRLVSWTLRTGGAVSRAGAGS